MIRICYIGFLFGPMIWAQSAFHNSGNLQLHGSVQIGFHTNWINNSNFIDTNGLVGFYGDNAIEVSGNTVPQLNDVEVFVPNNLSLQTSINIGNNLNFIAGDVNSPLNTPTIYLNWEQDAFFTGENDTSKVTGYAAVTDKADFSFPVGDEEQLRPLLMNSDANNTLALCAYLFENPSNPFALNESFDTDQKVPSVGEVTETEFWILQAVEPTTVTLSWNPRSDLGSIANTVDDIVLVGWSKSSSQWVAIGNTGISGDLEQGFLVSEKFVPNDFAALTFGTVPLPTDTFVVNTPSLGEYFISPNGDGTNDFLVFDDLADAGDNFVVIYNKFGQKVFEQSNYTNEFNGVSNVDNFVINREIGLPEGIYYYIVNLIEDELQYQGFFFLDRWSHLFYS